MDRATKLSFVESFNNTFQPPFSGSIPDYIFQNVELPSFYGTFAGKFYINLCPYLSEVFSTIQDEETELIHVVGAAATGKTLCSELAIPYWLTQAPGNILKVHQKIDVLADYMKPRLVPLLKSCKQLESLLKDRSAVTKDHIYFPDGTTIKLCSPTESDLHGYHCKYLCIDEAHLLEAGTIEKAILRTQSNVGRGRKTIVSSTPGVEGGELSTSMRNGYIFEWGWKCPKCSAVGWLVGKPPYRGGYHLPAAGNGW